MKLPKFKEGSLYLIEFWDHSATGENICYSDVVGYFYEQDKMKVVLLYWRTYINGPGTGLDEKNVEMCNICKANITKVKKID